MGTVGWGVIGCGGIADRRTIPEGILPAKNSELIAVMGRRESEVRDIAKKYGVKKYYLREKDLLGDPEVEAVYIATPNYLHARQAIAAAEAGKHVLCEKPLATTIEKSEDIIATCERNKVKLAVGFMMRFHACHQKAIEIIKQRLIGQLVMGRAQLTCWYPEIPGAWRQNPKLGGGGSLMDMGIHCIDLLRMFFGEVKEASAFVDTLVFSYPVEDMSTAILRFESKAHGIIDNYFNVPDAAAQNMLEIYGTRGCILARGTIGQSSLGKLTTYISEVEREYEAAQRREAAGIKMEELSPTPVNIYQTEIEDFAECIEKNLEPLNSGSEAIKNLKVVLAAYESAKTGKRVLI